MENHHSSGAPPNAMGSSGCPENKDVAVPKPNLSSAAEVSATVATSNDNLSKGKSVATDNKEQELKPHIIAERKRRNRINDCFAELQALLPQIPQKSGKATIVGHAIDYIQSLEMTKAMLEKRKQELALARQAAALAAAYSSSAPPRPQSVQGVAAAAMSSDVPDACSDVLPPLLQPLASAVPVPAPQLVPATMSADVVPQPLQQPLAGMLPAPSSQLPVTAGPVRFQTWTFPNLVLSVSNDNAYLNVCAPRDRGTPTMVMLLSVLNKYGIDVLSAQVDSDAVRSVFNIYARVTAMGGDNPSALNVYKLAVSEILAGTAQPQLGHAIKAAKGVSNSAPAPMLICSPCSLWAGAINWNKLVWRIQLEETCLLLKAFVI